MTVIDIGNLLDTCKDEYFLVEESTGNIYIINIKRKRKYL